MCQPSSQTFPNVKPSGLLQIPVSTNDWGMPKLITTGSLRESIFYVLIITMFSSSQLKLEFQLKLNHSFDTSELIKSPPYSYTFQYAKPFYLIMIVVALILVVLYPYTTYSPSGHKSQCTSAGCCGTNRAPGHGQSQNDHTQ